LHQVEREGSQRNLIKKGCGQSFNRSQLRKDIKAVLKDFRVHWQEHMPYTGDKDTSSVDQQLLDCVSEELVSTTFDAAEERCLRGPGAQYYAAS